MAYYTFIRVPNASLNRISDIDRFLKTNSTIVTGIIYIYIATSPVLNIVVLIEISYTANNTHTTTMY